MTQQDIINKCSSKTTPKSYLLTSASRRNDIPYAFKVYRDTLYCYIMGMELPFEELGHSDQQFVLDEFEAGRYKHLRHTKNKL